MAGKCSLRRQVKGGLRQAVRVLRAPGGWSPTRGP
jgi:hypothetical protein